MVGTFLVLDVFGLALLSRFIANPGVVTFRQTFVRRCHGGATSAGRLAKHAQLSKIQHFSARRRVVSRSPDDRAAGFHWPIAPTNRTANASRRRG